MATNDDYEIQLLDNETDARVCAQLLAEEFASNNPLTSFNKPTPKELFDCWLWPLVTSIIDEKLSFLIRYRPTNEIAAVITASDLFTFIKNDPYDANGTAADNPMFDFFGELIDQFVHHDFNQELKPKMVLYLAAGATRSNYAGKNLATQLRVHVCNHARDQHGFDYAFVQTSSPATRHIYTKKMNSKVVRVTDPASWVWKKKDNGLSRPVKDFKGEPITNILVNLKEQK